MSKWWYATGKVRQGPVDEAALAELVQQGVVGAATLVWREGMPAWAPFGATELARQDAGIAPSAPGPVPGPAPYVEGRAPTDVISSLDPRSLPAYDDESLTRLLMWAAIFGGLRCAASSATFLGFAGVSSPYLHTGATFAAAALWIPWAVFDWKLVHRLWEQVQDGRARTTPQLAATLGLVPLVCLYWEFVAVYGLAVEMRRVMDARGIPGPRPSDGLALAHCIVYAVATLFCGVCGVLLIPSIALWVVTFVQLRTAALAILRARRAQTVVGVPAPERA